MLALGGEDQQITVSNVEGDTVYSFSCTAEPSDIQFSEMKENERSNTGETTVIKLSVCVSVHSVLIDLLRFRSAPLLARKI